LGFVAAAAGCAATGVDGLADVLFVSLRNGAVLKNDLMLGLLSLAVSLFFRGIICSGTIEGKAQKILVSLRKKKREFNIFFEKKMKFARV
jgi:hypothetical protein